MDMKQHFTLNRKLLLPLAVLPFLYYGMTYLKRSAEIDYKLNELEQVTKKTKMVQRVLAKKQAQEKEFMDADRHYLENVLEPFRLLSAQQKLYETLKNDPLLSSKQTLQDNFLRFSEVNRKKMGALVEVEAKLMHPVALDEADLKTLLTMIEKVPLADLDVKPPFLAIKHMVLKKKNNHLELDLTLIKRERYENTL